MNTPAIFINCFEVPAGREDEFFELWSAVNRYMRQKPGFISNRLHRAVTADARFRFVNYVRWRSVEDFHAAHDEGFRELVQRPVWRDFPFSGAIYDIVVEHAADTADARDTNNAAAALGAEGSTRRGGHPVRAGSNVA
jgi:heme-degrading monooxygenase HmoA